MIADIGSDTEIAAIVRQFEQDGVCLTFCTVLEDYVAFYKTDADRAKIPPGFVSYSNAEPRTLYGSDQPDLSLNVLRRIDAAKKTG